MPRSYVSRGSAAHDDLRDSQQLDDDGRFRGDRPAPSTRHGDRRPDVLPASAPLPCGNGRPLAADRRESRRVIRRGRRSAGRRRRSADPRAGGRSTFGRDQVPPLGPQLGFGRRQADDTHEIGGICTKHSRTRRLVEHRRADRYERHSRRGSRATSRSDGRAGGAEPTRQLDRPTDSQGRQTSQRTASRRGRRPAQIFAARLPARRWLGRRPRRESARPASSGQPAWWQRHGGAARPARIGVGLRAGVPARQWRFP